MMVLRTLYRRFAHSIQALAAVEFALIMPVLLILFLASFDASNAIAIYLKVHSATYTLAAISNQYATGNNSIQSTDMTAITGSTAAVLAPYSSTPIVVKVTQVKATSASRAAVSWSASLNGTPYSQGASWTLPSQFTSTSACGSYPCYYIFAEVSYKYTPTFGYFATGAITMSDNIYVTPRSSVCVQYNSVPSSC